MHSKVQLGCRDRGRVAVECREAIGIGLTPWRSAKFSLGRISSERSIMQCFMSRTMLM